MLTVGQTVDNPLKQGDKMAILVFLVEHFVSNVGTLFKIFMVSTLTHCHAIFLKLIILKFGWTTILKHTFDCPIISFGNVGLDCAKDEVSVEMLADEFPASQ